MRRNDSAFIREGQEHMKYHNGICIDLFILYNVPDNYILRQLYYGCFFGVRKILYSEVGKVGEKNRIKRWIYMILSKIPKEYVFKFSNAIFYRKLSENVDLMYIPNARSCKYGIPRKNLIENIELEFEGKVFYAMSGYDEILKMAYGDYMTFPPEQERESHNPASKIIFPTDID